MSDRDWMRRVLLALCRGGCYVGPMLVPPWDVPDEPGPGRPLTATERAAWTGLVGRLLGDPADGRAGAADAASAARATRRTS
jgi:hypothetical protein